MTNGSTVGTRHGGHFVFGDTSNGWQSDSLVDSIDYDIPTCNDCTAEFDVTNFGAGEGSSIQIDVKWFSMGDGSQMTPPGLNPFRDSPWKMHLEQRSDGDGTGMQVIWRNGAADADTGGDPDYGDHRGKFLGFGGPSWQFEGVSPDSLDHDQLRHLGRRVNGNRCSISRASAVRARSRAASRMCRQTTASSWAASRAANPCRSRATATCGLPETETRVLCKVEGRSVFRAPFFLRCSGDSLQASCIINIEPSRCSRYDVTSQRPPHTRRVSGWFRG